jgi:hypothetical protein
MRLPGFPTVGSFESRMHRVGSTPNVWEGSYLKGVLTEICDGFCSQN